MTPQTDELVFRLNRLDCCAVSDALDMLGLPSSVTGLKRLATDNRIAGRVVTVKLVAASEAPDSQHSPRHLGTTAIESAGPGDVIVIEQRTGIEAGSWGGILTLGAKMRGIAGVIAEGLVRDIDEASSYRFPVFARGTTARTARGRVVESKTNDVILIGEVSVHPGDFVIADGSAVAFIPAAAIGQVLDAAEAIAAREATMAKALLNGDAITRVMGANYENMLKKSAEGDINE